MRSRLLLAASFLILLLPVSTRAQSIGQPGCGAENDRVAVTTTTEKTALKAVPGKAVIVWLQNDDRYTSSPRPTNLIGIDGRWVGATHGQSYFVVEVDPGLHHFCTNWQGTLATDLVGSALQLRVEAGGVYYLEIADIHEVQERGSIGAGRGSSTLQLADPDRGELLRRVYELAVLKTKK